MTLMAGDASTGGGVHDGATALTSFASAPLVTKSAPTTSSAGISHVIAQYYVPAVAAKTQAGSDTIDGGRYIGASGIAAAPVAQAVHAGSGNATLGGGHGFDLAVYGTVGGTGAGAADHLAGFAFHGTGEPGVAQAAHYDIESHVLSGTGSFLLGDGTKVVVQTTHHSDMTHGDGKI